MEETPSVGTRTLGDGATVTTTLGTNHLFCGVTVLVRKMLRAILTRAHPPKRELCPPLGHNTAYI